MKKPWATLIILLVAIVALVALSLVPWNSLSNGKLKDFNLIGDILPPRAEAQISFAENIDPELNKIDEIVSSIAAQDSIEETPEVLKEIPTDFQAPRLGETILLEDYTKNSDGIRTLRNILNEAHRRPVRIAMVGDSYIEGDIFAQDVRSGLQDIYGGNGVGYMAAFSSIPGFRASVNQTASGWEEHEIRKMKNDPLRNILGTYFTSTGKADTRFRKSLKPAHADHWERTSVMFCTTDSGTIKFSRPSENDTVFTIYPSENIQFLTLPGYTTDVRFTSSLPGLKVLGFWLEGSKGIVLDNISLRGNSGVSHRELNGPTTAGMRKFIDYDIIILEFGMNALSATQKNYEAYGSIMADVAENLKKLYPNALILMLGVGDRGYKNGTDLGSIPTIRALIKAQRTAALKSGALFWDTREAMGGDGAAVEWHTQNLVNSDYVHLNHKGGRKLAEIFLNSLNVSLAKDE